MRRLVIEKKTTATLYEVLSRLKISTVVMMLGYIKATAGHTGARQSFSQSSSTSANGRPWVGSIVEQG